MKNNDSVYHRLQAHLDSQPVGFPATRSGAEIRILKHIFTPREAQIATCLRHRFEPLEAVFERAGDLVASPDELAHRLGRIQAKGGIESKTKEGRKHYCNAPLVVGMYELQINRLSTEFIKDFAEYTRDRKFGIEFLSTELPQMRTIPVAKSIRPEHHVSTFDEVASLLDEARGPFVILECICRKKNVMGGGSCEVTDRKETCLALGSIAQTVAENNFGREIDREEALSIIAQNQKQGLVLQPSNSKAAEFICSCCGCCCGMLDIQKKLPRPLDFWASNFHAAVDADSCDGCGVCEKRCHVNAVHVTAKKQTAVVDLNRCLGCGVCIPSCPKQALSLVKKPTETTPPQTREDLFDIIMANKKGRTAKLKLTGKLVVDAIREGRTDLLR